MKRLLIIIAIISSAAITAHAQNLVITAVTATVKDANGGVYSNCQWSVTFVGQNTNPVLYQPQNLLNGQQGTCDGTGTFTVNLADNIQTITPTPSQWSFSICSGIGYTGGPFCKSNMLITITGNTQNISSLLTAQLGLLPVINGGCVNAVCASLSANNTFTGNNTLTAGQNNINFFKHNAIVWAGPESSKYLTIEAAQTDAQCATTNECQNELSSNFTETSTVSGISLGSGAGGVYQHVHGFPGAHFTCNVTGGTACITMNTGSGISGELTGETAGTSGGLLFSYPSTANVSCVFCVPNQSGGQSYIKLSTLFVIGNASATVPIVADLVGVNNQPILENLYFANFPSIGMNVRSGAASGAVAGPFLFSNVWMDGSNNAGARPWVFTADATSHNSIGGIDIQSGVANHPGSGKNMMEFNGNSAGTMTMRGINVEGTYFEDLAVSSSTIAVKMTDVHAAHFAGIPQTLTANGTGFDINQSGSGRACGIVIEAANEASPGNTATLINNHITSFTTTGPDVPFYLYGGDSSCSTVPFTVESLPAVFSAVGNAAIAVPVGEITSKFSGATLHGIVEVDTEASGKTVGFGPGSTAVGRYSFVDTSDSNTELFSCAMNTTPVCGIRSLVIGTSNASSAATTALGISNNALLDAAANPTIAGAGCGGSGATIVNPNGTGAFTINVGTAPTSGGCTITMPAAAHGWACFVTDITTNSTSVFLQKQVSTGSPTTSVNLVNYSDVAVATAPTASDIWQVMCRGF